MRALRTIMESRKLYPSQHAMPLMASDIPDHHDLLTVASWESSMFDTEITALYESFVMRITSPNLLPGNRHLVIGTD